MSAATPQPTILLCRRFIVAQSRTPWLCLGPPYQRGARILSGLRVDQSRSGRCLCSDASSDCRYRGRKDPHFDRDRHCAIDALRPAVAACRPARPSEGRYGRHRGRELMTAMAICCRPQRVFPIATLARQTARMISPNIVRGRSSHSGGASRSCAVIFDVTGVAASATRSRRRQWPKVYPPDTI
jgi:hypothetical protein